MLAFILGWFRRRRQSKPNPDSVFIRGVLSSLYDERGYPRDPQ